MDTTGNTTGNTRDIYFVSPENSRILYTKEDLSRSIGNSVYPGNYTNTNFIQPNGECISSTSPFFDISYGVPSDRIDTYSALITGNMNSINGVVDNSKKLNTCNGLLESVSTRNKGKIVTTSNYSVIDGYNYQVRTQPNTVKTGVNTRVNWITDSFNKIINYFK